MCFAPDEADVEDSLQHYYHPRGEVLGSGITQLCNCRYSHLLSILLSCKTQHVTNGVANAEVTIATFRTMLILQGCF